MKIGFSTGWAELDNYWGRWPWSKQYGGSENTLIEVACELAAAGHEVTARLPYTLEPRVWRGVQWVGHDVAAQQFDLLFCFDDFERHDRASRIALVATRSDPPRHRDFDVRIYWSKFHANLLDPGCPHVGGGVRLSDYAERKPRIPQRVIYTSSPDRGGHHAEAIGRGYDFVATYKGRNELTREALVDLQQRAMVQIHPYDAVRESEFFCMSVLEALAAGTPCVISDGPALVELWGEVATVLPRPIDYAEWDEEIADLLEDTARWRAQSDAGRALAASYDWPIVAQRFLNVALEG